ncbi:WD repeat-containing protein [Nitzschia inconspicua]|uniref:WD repeat-containing protein n=1 Tax=Nitzschia inconspicua TaxID=303405 RepID=A0A9K3KPM4_9STRA|nr:WD repeat-containing protein [Nitzschia inconspicua]
MDEIGIDAPKEDPSAGTFHLAKSSRAGGPVTSVALAKSLSDDDDDGDMTSEQPTLAFAAQGSYITRYNLLCEDNQEEEHQLLVFPEGGTTIHGIVFCPELQAIGKGDEQNSELRHSGNIQWDSIVFGEKRIAFCNIRSRYNPMERFDVAKVSGETSGGKRDSTLALSDWILSIKQVGYPERNSGRSISPVSLVVGFARHFVELWKVITEVASKETLVDAVRLRRLHLTPATMVTSMDCFYNQLQDRIYIAAGTSFHKIWVSSETLNETETVSETVPKSTCLKEHAGVVHAVKFSRKGDTLISCSDDRSVRWWIWDEAIDVFRQQWVGWGHNARVWSVSFGSCDESLVVSASEDGTARIWCASSGGSLACIQYGAASSSVWGLDVFGNTMVIGPTDGIISMYNLSDRIRGRNLKVIDSICIPDDRPKVEEKLVPVVSARLVDPLTSQEKKKKAKRKKRKPQVVVGMKWWRYPDDAAEEGLLVSTREGSLVFLDVHTQTWIFLDQWCVSSLSSTHGFHPSDGCCMAVHPNSRSIAIGTTKGHIVLVTVTKGRETKYILLDGHCLRSVQGLKWLSGTSLVSFHVRSLAMWDVSDCSGDNPVIAPSIVFSMQTNGVPLSCDYDPLGHRMLVGDSRGSLSLYCLRESKYPVPLAPVSILPRAHHKEHVNDIRWLDNSTIISVGNDGCLRVSYVEEDSLSHGWSFPAPSVTGYESIHLDTYGRQRILDCSVQTLDTNEMTAYHSNVAVCMGQKDGSNSIHIQQLQGDHPCKGDRVRGVKLHGETIFGSTMFTLRDTDTEFLVSASEDCTTRISAWRNGRIVDSLMLTPQSSCVRCVCCSQIDGSSALLIVGGGKLTIQFFLVQTPAYLNCSSIHDLTVRHLGCGLTTPKKETKLLDQRMNDVECVPLSEKDRVHLVIAGDSNGMVHLFLVSESLPSSHASTMGIKIPISDWPIICVRAVVIFDRVLVMFGTTKGNVMMIDLPKSANEIRDAIEFPDELWSFVGNFEAHCMGTNCIDAHVSQEDKSSCTAEVSVVTGGDDHSLSFAHLTVQKENDDAPISLVCVSKMSAVPGASYSAVKSVFYLFHQGQQYLVSVGYSQTLCFWKIFNHGEESPVEVISSVPVALGDVNCMSYCISTGDTLEVWIAVCGMGVEMFKLRKLQET